MTRRILVIAHPSRRTMRGALDAALETLTSLGTEPVTEYVHGDERARGVRAGARRGRDHAPRGRR